MAKAGVPDDMRVSRTKPEIALAEIDRLIETGVRFGVADPASQPDPSGNNSVCWKASSA